MKRIEGEQGCVPTPPLPPAELQSPSAVFVELLRALESMGVPSCVVGDSRELPETISSDVDLVVPVKSLKRLPGLLREFCTTRHLKLVQVLQHECQALYFAIAWFDATGSPRFLNPDVCGDFLRWGQCYLRASTLLANRIPATDGKGRSRGFQVPMPAHAFVYYLIKRIDKLSLDQRHGAYLSEQWQLDPEGADRLLQTYWPSSDARFLAQVAADGKWGATNGRLPDLQRALRQQRPLSWSTRAGELARKARRVSQPTGLMVAFLGPDGSGKSTVMERVQQDLLPAFRRTKRIHLRPHLGRSAEGANSVTTDPHEKAPRGLLGTLAKLAYLWFDYSAGYVVKVRPLLVRSTFVLFDRYYHDLLVDPTRYRLRRLPLLSRLLGRLIPHPDCWVVLDAPPDVLLTRKQELPQAELARQRKEYGKLSGRLANCLEVDATNSAEQVAHLVSRFVLTQMSLRMDTRTRKIPASREAFDSHTSCSDAGRE